MSKLNWIERRIINDRTVGYLTEKIESTMADTFKESFIKLLEDEDIAYALTQYGDALYDRYHKKFFGAIGGIQKGINASVEDANPLSQVFNADGAPDLRSILGLLLSGGFKGLAPSAGSGSGISTGIGKIKGH